MSSGKGTKTSNPGVSRSFVANCPVITLFTPVNPQETMGKINLLVLELFSVAGVVHGKEIKSVVVAEEYTTARRNIRLFIGNQVINNAAYPQAFLRMHLNLVIVRLLGKCKKVRAINALF